MLYSSVNFTGAPDAQCLQGMLYSLVNFTGARAPDAQCLQGMLYLNSLLNFTITGQQMPNVCRECCIPQGTSPGTRCPMFAGNAVFEFPVELHDHWATDAQCLQGMLYFPVNFTGAPGAQCLQGMPYSPINFTGLQMPNVCRGCHIPWGTSLGTRCPMFAGDAVFPGELHQDTRCLMLCGLTHIEYVDLGNSLRFTHIINYLTVEHDDFTR